MDDRQEPIDQVTGLSKVRSSPLYSVPRSDFVESTQSSFPILFYSPFLKSHNTISQKRILTC